MATLVSWGPEDTINSLDIRLLRRQRPADSGLDAKGERQKVGGGACPRQRANRQSHSKTPPAGGRSGVWYGSTLPPASGTALRLPGFSLPGPGENLGSLRPYFFR